MSSAYAVIDQGGQSLRVLLYSHEGECLLRYARKLQAQVVFLDQNKPNETRGYQYDAKKLVAELEPLLIDFGTGLSALSEIRLRAFALVCQRSNALAWRRSDGEPLSPVLSWQDTRARHYLTPILKQYSQADLQQMTGLRYNDHLGAAKMAWCLDYAKTGGADEADLVVGPLSAYLTQVLTKSSVAWLDVCQAARTGLWNLHRRCWQPELLQLFQLPTSVLPEVVANNSNFGPIKLPQGQVPLKFVNGDQNCQVFANGLYQAEQIFINVGTGAFILAPVSPTPKGLLETLIIEHQGASQMMAEGTVHGAAAAIHWFLQSLPEEVATALDHQQIFHIKKTDSLFINGVGGLGSPDWRSVIRSHFIGAGGVEEQLLAVYESILFMLQRNLESMLGAGKQIRLGGGISQLDGFCQRLADLSGLRVVRHVDSEASARGAAYWLASCPNKWQSDADNSLFLPQPNQCLQQRYEQWQRYMPQHI